VHCSPDGSRVRCLASMFGRGDLTAEVDWWASEAFIFPMESDEVVFHEPGLLTPLRPTNIYIRTRNPVGLSPLSFAVSPTEPAVPTASIHGNTLDQAGSPLADVTVEIIHGPDAGKRPTPILNPHAYTFEHLQLWTPRIFRASKMGYHDDIQEHSGIEVVDGYPRNTALHFRLRPREQTQ
jgi:hypothetical protein